MDYKEKVIALLNSQELSKEQKEKLEEIFPELKESEDDDIRKKLISFFQRFPYENLENAGLSAKDAITWLEKQGEHANFRNKIQIGDKVTRNEDGVLVNLSQLNRVAKKQGEQKPAENLIETWKDMRLEVYQQASGNRHEPNYSDDTTKMFSLNDIDEIVEKMSEQKSADKVEPKFHEGDIIKPKDGGHEPWQIMQVDIFDKKYRFKDGYVIHFSQEDDYELVEQKPAECNNSALKDKLLELFQRFRWYCKDETPTNGDIIEYVDAHIQELIDTMQKPAWSEEDEYNFAWLYETLIGFDGNDLESYNTPEFLEKCKKVINWLKWLKSLRPQNRWKPSDDQMRALTFACIKNADIDKSSIKALYDLKEHLKQL